MIPRGRRKPQEREEFKEEKKMENKEGEEKDGEQGRKREWVISALSPFTVLSKVG